MKRTEFETVTADGTIDSLVASRLDDELDVSGLAINHYLVPSGERLPAGLHAHADQEELFVVLSGVATFETLDGEVLVEADEIVRFSPGEFQAGKNDHEDLLAVLALGAPAESADVRIPIDCLLRSRESSARFR
ncbi:cupin domain-containing protein [Halovivax gelatinilyticus]|uniref:cupin domain-containing protein n=1 Tax=Halovivax gelatinilyticus TaxID=2961597 RepID=UPI0020CA851A|nr:cupin domain-containing protein [Halovivax gelatinilyticus]